MSEPSSHRISSRTRSGHFTRTRTAPTVAPEAPGVEAEVVAMVDRMKGIFFDVSFADMLYIFYSYITNILSQYFTRTFIYIYLLLGRLVYYNM